MNNNRFRWTRLCVSTTTVLFIGYAWNAAGASQVHVLQHGETLASVARKYQVPVKDILTANGITNPNNVPDGRRLVIPDPPKRLAVPPVQHKSMVAKADRVNLRLGPGGDYRSNGLFDMGTPLVVTAEKDGWAQVMLQDGRGGWVRQDMLKSTGKSEPARQANNTPRPNQTPKLAPVIAIAPPNRSRGNAATKSASASAGSSRKSHETQHPPKLAHNSGHAQAAKHSSHVDHATKTAHHTSSSKTKQVAYHDSHATRHGAHYAEEGAPGDSNVVRSAYAFRGTPYRYGSSGGGSFDCSGFTSYIYAKHGVSLPHSAKGQFSEGRKVSRDEMKPGDLVFFHTVTSGISHVGIYVGNGKFVHCSSRRSGGVRVDDLGSGYYSKAFRGARRVK